MDFKRIENTYLNQKKLALIHRTWTQTMILDRYGFNQSKSYCMIKKK